MNKKNTFNLLVVLSLLLTQLALAPVHAAQATICDAAQFVADITIQDGTPKNVGDSFDKTWRLKNVGSCPWSTSYTLVYDSGNQMGTTASVPFSKSVAPGETIDLTVNLTAPNVSGLVRGYWKLKNAAGVLFGIGAAADKAFWVEILVSTSGGGGIAYDFVKNAASATWTSGAGALTFPGSAGDANGAGLKVDNPKFENGAVGGAPGLLMTPQNVTNGFVQAQYPAYHVQNGDHFKSIVNCDYGATNCYVNFRLDYQIGTGPVITFWTFNEKYEGFYYAADRDISSLAGQDVKFILRVGAAGFPAGDRAVWGAPRITSATGGTPPTPTITPTPGGPTKTPVPTSSCDRATFVSDEDVPDGKVFAPDTAFTKTWKLRNTGTCTWTTSYKLVLVSGDSMGAISNEINLTSTIAPNTTVPISVTLKAPSTNGSYRGYWQFKNKDGALFGIGASADKPFWVDITVRGGSTTTAVPTVTGTPPTPIPGPSKTATPNVGPDRALFVSETVLDGTAFASSTAFRKTWRIKNNGTSTWGAGYKLVFVNGDQMSGPNEAPLPASVAPNGTVDISVDLISPAANGHYKGYWMFKNASGAFFGIGATANVPFWVDINVTSTGSTTATPGPKPTSTATPQAQASGPYGVVGVAANDGLNVRSGPGVSNPTVVPSPGLSYKANNIVRTGQVSTVSSAEWWEIQKPGGGTGWVNALFLTEYVPSDTFCKDAKVTALLTSLGNALKSADGAALAALISPKHGADIRLVTNYKPVNYTQATAASIFTSTTVQDWGPAASSGIDTKGTFKEIIQPKLLDVYNSSYQLSCSDTSKVGGAVGEPWPAEYTTVNFYSLYKPPSAADKQDWRTFLIGIEYVNGQPYLFSLIHFVYGP